MRGQKTQGAGALFFKERGVLGLGLLGSLREYSKPIFINSQEGTTSKTQITQNYY